MPVEMLVTVQRSISRQMPGPHIMWLIPS